MRIIAPSRKTPTQCSKIDTLTWEDQRTQIRQQAQVLQQARFQWRTSTNRLQKRKDSIRTRPPEISKPKVSHKSCTQYYGQTVPPHNAGQQRPQHPESTAHEKHHGTLAEHISPQHHMSHQISTRGIGPPRQKKKSIK